MRVGHGPGCLPDRGALALVQSGIVLAGPAGNYAMQLLEPIISVRGLRVAYGANEVLKGIDLSIAKGSLVALLGACGCAAC